MQFRTPVKINRREFGLSHFTSTLMLGSCFTENIGRKLQYYKFPVMTNPFGVLYNPHSIKNAAETLTGKQHFSEELIGEHNNKWFSFYHDTSYSAANKKALIEKIESAKNEAAEFLKKTSLLIITFGTGWAFRHIDKNIIVANCHKLPSRDFHRELLSPENIIANYKELINEIYRINPKVQIIFTVSPIRHWRDGAVKNQLSKASLIYSIHKIIEQYPKIDYFPSYEIVMDELRDYRFYAKDMIHLNETAIDYIWERFAETYITENSFRLMSEVEKIQKAKSHRPFNPKSTEYQNFLYEQIKKTKQLADKYPVLDLSEEIEFFNSKIDSANYQQR